MKTASLLYTFFLLLEGALAWLLGQESLLLAAVTCGLAGYTLVRHHPRAVSEGVRLGIAAILAIAGPLHYQNALIPLLLCFLALPHYLAATQALGESDPTPPGKPLPRRNPLIFSIAFYAAMALVFLLAQGLEPALPRLLTSLLALLVLLAALAAWDLSRQPRLRPSLRQKGFSWKHLTLPLGLLALAALLFSGPLPWLAQTLARLSPHWRIPDVEFKNKPPHRPPTETASRPAAPDKAIRPGVDESALTGEHRLPSRSDLQTTESPRFLLQPELPATAATLTARGPVYLRSHTLNRFSDNKWTPEVSGGVWIEDAADGTADGRIQLHHPPATPGIAHEIFALGADGYTLPTLPGLIEIDLPRVFAIPGDLLQTSATGDIHYRAVSSPVFYHDLPNPALLQPGDSGNAVHLKPAEGTAAPQLQALADKIFQNQTLLADRITALHAWFAKNVRYSTVMENRHTLGPLENFLFDERRGHCDFYATAATLLLRQAGIPTRIAYGFASSETDSASGMVILRDRHAHAWTEIYLQDHGWTLCDFTPGENVGQPTPADQPPPAPLPDLKQFSNAAKDAAAAAPIVKPVEETSAFAKLLAWFQQLAAHLPPFRYLATTLGGILLLLALARLWRRPPVDPAQAAAAARAAAERQPAYYQELLRLTAAIGHPKPESSTPLEHYHHLQQAGLPVAPLRPLLHYHCATRYEDAPRDSTLETTFLQLLTTQPWLTPQPPA